MFTLAFFFKDSNFAVLNPKGIIAEQQRDLFITATLLMLIVVLPVLVLTFVIAWKYRESNTQAKYSPEVDGNRKLETIWWTVPLVIIAVLSGIIWKSSHDLDPFKPIAADKEPITIQVVSMRWKWLFIYPEQNIATVNYVEFPKDTPVNFRLTSDASMNSFWIPQLGGQIYTMAGMETKLHLMANETGEFNGLSANLSGDGFSGMKFIAKASTETEFKQWVDAVQLAPRELGENTYQQLLQPSKDVPPLYYASVEKELYNSIIDKYLAPDGAPRSVHGH